jgi:hypothetical protein
MYWPLIFPFQKQQTTHHELMNCCWHFFNYCCISFNFFIHFATYYIFSFSFSFSSIATEVLQFLQLLHQQFHFFNYYCIFISSIVTVFFIFIFIFFNLLVQVYLFNCYWISSFMLYSVLFIWGLGFLHFSST